MTTPASLGLNLETTAEDRQQWKKRGDDAGRMSRDFAKVTDALTAANKLLAEQERLIYVPGLWRCPKCKFQLQQMNLNAADGSVTARNEPGDKCPNCDSPLWRVTERQAGNDMIDMAEKAIMERNEATKRAETAEALLAAPVGDEVEEVTDELDALGRRYGGAIKVVCDAASALLRRQARSAAGMREALECLAKLNEHDAVGKVLDWLTSNGEIRDYDDEIANRLEDAKTIVRGVALALSDRKEPSDG